MFTAGEQTFYANRGLQNEPTRCLSCRNSRRTGGAPVDDGYVHYGPFASFGGRNPRQMHPATCARCNQMTEVPFVPRGDRPVYCSECFSVMRVSAEASPRQVDARR
jgi:CxxC-x17-CxxC domain-containing protein